MNPQIKETQLVSYFIRYLTLRGWTVWRNNTISGRLQEGRFIHNGIKGSPDIVGFWPCLQDCDHSRCGVFIGIEVKRDAKGARQSFDQVRFEEKVKETKHGVYIVARRLEDIWEQLEDYQKPPLPF